MAYPNDIGMVGSAGDGTRWGGGTIPTQFRPEVRAAIAQARSTLPDALNHGQRAAQAQARNAAHDEWRRQQQLAHRGFTNQVAGEYGMPLPFNPDGSYVTPPPAPTGYQPGTGGGTPVIGGSPVIPQQPMPDPVPVQTAPAPLMANQAGFNLGQLGSTQPTNTSVNNFWEDAQQGGTANNMEELFKRWNTANYGGV